MKKKILYYSGISIGVLVLFMLMSGSKNNTQSLNERQGILINGGKLSRINPISGISESIEIKSFYLDKNLTTVEEFDEFVKQTGYITEAHKFGNSAVLVNGNWELVDGANYLYPFGRDKAQAELNHPVTQVSWNDAVAYGKWKGKRLPTEAEWEYAATIEGKKNYKFAWGEDLIVDRKYRANVWQGTFPTKNTILDGYEFSSPIGAYPANELGIYDLGGNVWQWCSDSILPTQAEAIVDPSLRHPTKGASFQTDISNDPSAPIFAHASSTAETGISHTGFRLANDAK